MDDRIQAFIDYATRYHRAFSNQIQGATASEIEALQALVARRLPEFYRQFLSRMGRHDGGLDLGAGASTAIRDVIEYYSEIVRLGEQEVALPPRCIVIGVSGLDVPELSLLHDNDHEPRVVSTSGRQIKHPIAASLERLLYRTAFIDFHSGAHANAVAYYANHAPEIWDRARTLAEGEGFQGEWFSDDWSFCGERNETLIAMTLIDEKNVWIRLSSHHSEAVLTIGKRFQESFELTRLPTSSV